MSDSTLNWLKNSGKLRQGRRTPETIYVSLDDNLDDRTTNFPVTLIQDVDLGGFVVEAVNEKLARGRRPADPEAWLADQLAQVQTVSTEFGDPILHWDPTESAFEAVLKLAQEYGEMCAARATEPFVDRKEFLIAGDPVKVHVDGSPAADSDQWTGEVLLEKGDLVVRPKED